MEIYNAPTSWDFLAQPTRVPTHTPWHATGLSGTRLFTAATRMTAAEAGSGKDNSITVTAVGTGSFVDARPAPPPRGRFR